MRWLLIFFIYFIDRNVDEKGKCFIWEGRRSFGKYNWDMVDAMIYLEIEVPGTRITVYLLRL